MSAKGVKNFIAAVDLEYPAPQFGGDKNRQAGWFALATSELSGYPDDVLATVGKKIIREWTGQFFPKISKVREFCEEIMESKRALETPLLAAPKELHPFAAERFDLARDLAKSPIGQQANREGWAVEFFQFCVENMKAPKGEEIAKCKEKARKFQAEYERCLKQPGDVTQAFARYAQRMVDKAREFMDGAQ